MWLNPISIHSWSILHPHSEKKKRELRKNWNWNGAKECKRTLDMSAAHQTHLGLLIVCRGDTMFCHLQHLMSNHTSWYFLQVAVESVEVGNCFGNCQVTRGACSWVETAGREVTDSETSETKRIWYRYNTDINPLIHLYLYNSSQLNVSDLASTWQSCSNWKMTCRMTWRRCPVRVPLRRWNAVKTC